MIIRCIAIDDEPRALDVVKHHIAKLDDFVLLAVFVDPFSALNFINEQAVDVIFLDINMPDFNGIQFAQQFTGRPPLIVFTTAHSEFALDSYEANAVDYLLKPFDFTRFFKAAQKIRERLKSPEREPLNFFFVNTGHARSRIFYRDILFVQSEGNYVFYVTHTEKIMVRTSMKEVLNLLPSSDFIQIHKSYVIALQWIEKIQDNQVFIAQERIAIGPAFKEAFLQRVDSLHK